MRFSLVIFTSLLSGILFAAVVLPVSAFEFGGGQSGGYGSSGSYNEKKDIIFYPSVYWPGLENLGWTETGGIVVKPDTLGKYIVEIYKFFTGATAILALFMITYGGLLWLLAGGNQGTIGQAKDIITGALSGMIIALLAYALLATISQGLVSFKSLNVRDINVPSGTSADKEQLVSQIQSLNAFTVGSTISNYPKQLSEASPELLRFLLDYSQCVKNPGPSYCDRLQINSISDNTGIANCTPNHNANCAHAVNSCHYGGSSCPGVSHAIDIQITSSLPFDQIKIDLERVNPNVMVLNEIGHLHMSIGGDACGCDTGL